MDIFNTWQKIQKDQSISKTLVFFKSLLENYPDLESMNLSFLLSEIFEKITLYLVTLYAHSESDASAFLLTLESFISLSKDPLLYLNFCELYNTLGTMFRKQGNLNRSLKLIQKGLDLSYIVPSPSLIKVFLNLNMAGVLSHSSKHKKALKFSFLASKQAEELNELILSPEDQIKIQEAICISYHTTGVQHEFLQNLTSALEWYTKAWDFGKKTINDQNIDLIEKIEKAVKAVQLKFHKNFLPKSKVNHRSLKNFTKINKSFNVSRTVFSAAGPKSRTFNGKVLRKSLSRSVLSRSSQRLSVAKLNKPQPVEEKKTSVVETCVKEPENYFKKVLNGLEQKVLKGNKETIACQTDQSTLTPYLLSKFKETKSTDFDYSFVEISENATELKTVDLQVELKENDLDRALVKCGKIDIHLRQYEVWYYINSSLTVLHAKVTNEMESYEFSYELNSEDSIMEVIDKVIHTKLDLVSQKLSLVDCSSFVLIKGMHVRNNSEIKVSITQKKPRAELNVVFHCIDKSFRGEFKLIEILERNKFELLEAQFIFCCFDVENDEIVLRVPPSLEMIYYKHHVLGNGFSYFVKISEVIFGNEKCFLIEGISASSPPVLPLFADLDLICRLAEMNESVILKNIEIIPTLINVRNSQLRFTQQKGLTTLFQRIPTKLTTEISSPEYDTLKQIVLKIQSVFRGSQVRKRLKKDEVHFIKRTINNIDYIIQIVDSPFNKILKLRVTSSKSTYTLQFKYPIPFTSPFKDTIPDLITFHDKSLIIKNPKSSTAFIFDNSTEFQAIKKIQEINLKPKKSSRNTFPEDFYGKIHFRTCVIRDRLIRQISMTLNQSETGEDMAEFLILSGTAKDDLQKMVIDLKSISEKSGIEKTKLTAIGFYVVRHMIFHGQGNMVCIDFESDIDNFEKNLIRVQAVIRGKLLRKRLKIDKRVVLYKKKANLNNFIWTVLLMKDFSRFYLILVKDFIVLKKVLNLSGFFSDGRSQDFEVLMRKVIIPEIKLRKYGLDWQMNGLEKYED
jgi:tetratricopeptide (TPR) repeat protein